MGTTWFVCVPAKELKMCTERAVRQTQQLRRKDITAKNPRRMSHQTNSRMLTTIDSYRNGPADSNTASQTHGWLWTFRGEYWTSSIGHIVDWGDGNNRGGRDLGCGSTVAYTDVPATVFGASRVAYLAIATMKWAEALMCTGYGAKRFHKAVMRAIWATTRAHWNSTCMQNAEAIRESGDTDLLNEMNSTIQDGRRSHARAPLRLDTLLRDHGELLQRRAEGWHEERERQLQLLHE